LVSAWRWHNGQNGRAYTKAKTERETRACASGPRASRPRFFKIRASSDKKVQDKKAGGTPAVPARTR